MFYVSTPFTGLTGFMLLIVCTCAIIIGTIRGAKRDHENKKKQQEAKKELEEFHRSWAAYEARMAYRDKETKKYFSLPPEEQEPFHEFLKRLDQESDQLEEALKKGQKSPF
jgi:hypothetical protein